MTLKTLQYEAKKRGLILERVNKIYDGVKYRYEVYDNNQFMSDLHATLNEAAAEILNYKSNESL